MQSKISVFPSEKREGIMTTILESAALKTSIIASNGCSNKEFIKNGVNGLLFKNKDEFDLAKKILTLTDEKLRERIQKEALKSVKKFSWKKQIKKIVNYYSSP